MSRGPVRFAHRDSTTNLMQTSSLLVWEYHFICILLSSVIDSYSGVLNSTFPKRYLLPVLRTHQLPFRYITLRRIRPQSRKSSGTPVPLQRPHTTRTTRHPVPDFIFWVLTTGHKVQLPPLAHSPLVCILYLLVSVGHTTGCLRSRCRTNSV